MDRRKTVFWIIGVVGLLLGAPLFAPEGGQKRMLAGALYPGDDTIRNHLSQETYDLLRRRFPELSLDRVGRFKPWALAMTIAVLEYQKMGLNYHHGIDVYFLDKATNGKRIREIERPDSVIDMLNGFSDEHQARVAQPPLLDLDQVREKTDRILHAWSDGDAATLETIRSESIHGHSRLMRVFDALFTQKHASMA